MRSLGYIELCVSINVALKTTGLCRWAMLLDNFGRFVKSLCVVALDRWFKPLHLHPTPLCSSMLHEYTRIDHGCECTNDLQLWRGGRKGVDDGHLGGNSTSQTTKMYKFK